MIIYIHIYIIIIHYIPIYIIIINYIHIYIIIPCHPRVINFSGCCPYSGLDNGCVQLYSRPPSTGRSHAFLLWPATQTWLREEKRVFQQFGNVFGIVGNGMKWTDTFSAFRYISSMFQGHFKHMGGSILLCLLLYTFFA